jgi:DNA-binding transcriptional ArsR family regulator
MAAQKEIDVFHALGDATRRAVLDGLRRGPRAVNDIAAEFPISRPAISKHLRVLLEAGLVEHKAAGRQNLYSLNPAPLREVDGWLADYRRFWADNLTNLKLHLEKKKQRSKW